MTIVWNHKYEEKVTGTKLQLVLTLDEFLSNLDNHAVYHTEYNSSHIVSSLDNTIVYTYAFQIQCRPT